MKKVLLTGATGLIGKEAIEPLKIYGYEVLPVNSKTLNLFDYTSVLNTIQNFRPEFLLHFAWITGGDYLFNPINEKYYSAGINLLEQFIRFGGKRAVFAGTCLEYEISDNIIDEKTPLNPQTPYAKNKVRLFYDSTKISRDCNCSFAWGRVFYVFGRDEKLGRLTNCLAESVKKKQPVTIRNSQLVRDYMYSKEIANAFVSLLGTDYNGPVNICSGKGISIGDFSRQFAKRLNGEQYIKLFSESTDQPPKIVGNADVLINEIGYKYKYSLYSALDDLTRDILL